MRTEWFLLSQGLVILLALIPLGYMALRQRRLKALQNQLVERLDLRAANAWFRVNLASPAFYKKRLRVMAFEGKGLLLDLGDRLQVVGELGQCRRLERTYPKHGMAIDWIGNANLHWMSLGSGPDMLYLTADTGLNALQSREATADLFSMLAPDASRARAARREFALEKNGTSLGVVIAFFAILAFALVDGFFLNRNELVEAGRLLWWAPLVMLPAVPCYRLLISEAVPARESLVLSLLLAVALTLAFVPAAKRLDQWLGSAAQDYRYRLDNPARLTPLQDGPPPLSFPRTPEYWQQFDVGSEHDLRLIHGPLGLWQLQRAELEAKMRAFYRGYDAR